MHQGNRAVIDRDFDDNSDGVEEVSRPQIVRQNRLNVAGENCILHLPVGKIEVSDCTPFGIATVNKTEIPGIIEFTDVPFTFEDVEVARLHVKKVRGEKLFNGEFKIAFEVVGEPIEIDKISAIRAAKLLVAQQEKKSNAYQGVPANFKHLVLEMKDWLEEMEAKVNDVESAVPKTSSNGIAIFEETISHIIGDYFYSKFDPVYALLKEELRDCNEKEIANSFSYFRDKIMSILLKAPLANRVYNKPLGYAGDYEMMNLIYKREVLGENLFAKCLHRYFVESPNGKAVRNREKYLRSKILTTIAGNQGQKCRILSVASGPALEIQNLLKTASSEMRNAEIHLLDQDLESLLHAQKQLKRLARESNVTIDVKYHNIPVKQVLASGLPVGEFHLIYSAGLFDYFSDPVAQIAGQKLFEHLRPSGELVIGNFNVSTPDQFTMDLALDWHLIYRSADDLRRLFGHSGGIVEVEHEGLGINLFSVIRRM